MAKGENRGEEEEEEGKKKRKKKERGNPKMKNTRLFLDKEYDVARMLFCCSIRWKE